MAVRTGTRDPRTIITPDAFTVADELLGLPLAPPRKRLAALLIDFAVIGVLILVTRSFALVLGVVVAGAFIRAGFKRTPVRGSVFDRAMRFSVGCLGVFVGVITIIIWLSVGFEMPSFGGGDESLVNVDGVVTAEDITAGDAASARAATFALGRARTADDARAAMRTLAEVGLAVGTSRADIRESILEVVPDDASWSADAPDLVDEVMAEFTEAEAPRPTPVVTALSEEIDALSTEEALRQYADLLEAGDTDSPRMAALDLRLSRELAQDTLGVLTERIADLQDEVDRQVQQIIQAGRDLEAANEGGLISRLRDLLDELGFGFSWAALYLTVALSVGKGQTVGKKMMGIRVLRLDGEPINWWVAFERGGGYAAGLATGLLGFAQVYWDSNRQAIHDHIVGTVVVLDGAEKVGNWEEAL